MNIAQALQKPLEILNGQNVEATFQTIATNLFNNFCIKCGKKTFYFAEVEIYYFNDGETNKKIFKLNDNWNEITYERSGYLAGNLFYHLSGVDICFNSELKKDIKTKKKSGYGGGILIRSIREIGQEEKLIVGPLTCLNEMLNACKSGPMPYLEEISEHCTTKGTYRYLCKNDFELIENEKKQKEKGKKNIDGSRKLAFYDDNIKEEEWNNARSKYYSNRLKLDLTKRK